MLTKRRSQFQKNCSNTWTLYPKICNIYRLVRLGKQSNIWQNRNNIFVCLQTYIFRKWGTRKLHIKYKEQMDRQHFFWKINERLNLLVSNIDNEPWRSSDRYKNGSIYQWEQKTCNVASKDRLLFSIIILSFYGGFRPSWDYILLKNSV